MAQYWNVNVSWPWQGQGYFGHNISEPFLKGRKMAEKEYQIVTNHSNIFLVLQENNGMVTVG